MTEETPESAAAPVWSPELVEALPIVAFVASADLTLLRVSRGWTRFIGAAADDERGSAFSSHVEPADAAGFERDWLSARAAERPFSATLRVFRRDGTARRVHAQFAPIRPFGDYATPVWFGTIVDAGPARRGADPHARSGRGSTDDAAARDARKRRRIEEGLRLLSRTGAAVVDSLDYQRTIRNIARAFVEGFAAYCLIDVMPPRGDWERTVEHRDPSFVPLLLALSPPKGNHPIARAIEAGESSFTTIDDAWALGLDSVDDRLDAIRRLRVRSIISVPVKTPSGAIVGAITCALDDVNDRENYGPDDLGFVEEVARRAGAAIANVQLYERERRIALELQAASLPAHLPTFPGVALDAAYRPGSNEAKIGGDWYDAFVLADGRLVLTVGDVLGHGLQAAVTMTKLRLAMQSAAFVDPDPHVMLRVADATLRLSDTNAYATAIAAVYDPVPRRVTFASAGHPGPALRDAAGNVEFLFGSGIMLGLRDGEPAATRTFPAPPGSTLVFYTDGLIEGSRDLDDGFGRLTRVLESAASIAVRQPAEALVDAVLGADEAHDDIAVLVARFL